MGPVEFSVILTWRYVGQISERVPKFQATVESLKGSVSPPFFYPDGSLEYEVHPETGPIWSALMMQVKQMRLHLSNRAPSRPCLLFARQRYGRTAFFQPRNTKSESRRKASYCLHPGG